MAIPNQMFLFVFVLLQGILMVGYFYELVLNPPSDQNVLWGCVPKKEHSSMLRMAAIAYALNVIFVLYFYRNGSSEECAKLTYALGTYYALQLAFIPLLKLSAQGRVGPRAVTWFLFLCVVPFLVVTQVGLDRIQMLRCTDKNLEALVLAILTFIPVGHVIFNDAISYGLQYPC